MCVRVWCGVCMREREREREREVSGNLEKRFWRAELFQSSDKVTDELAVYLCLQPGPRTVKEFGTLTQQTTIGFTDIMVCVLKNDTVIWNNSPINLHLQGSFATNWKISSKNRSFFLRPWLLGLGYTNSAHFSTAARFAFPSEVESNLKLLLLILKG